jgi:hypothetical protein
MPLVSLGSMSSARSLLSFSLASLVIAENCGVAPLALPLSNVTFGNGIAVNRGVPIQLGGQPEGEEYHSEHVLVR